MLTRFNKEIAILGENFYIFYIFPYEWDKVLFPPNNFENGWTNSVHKAFIIEELELIITAERFTGKKFLFGKTLFC